MSGVWITNAGSLGTFANGSFFDLQLEATDSNSGVLTYSLIAGALPSGLTINSGGYLSGNPVTDTTDIDTEKFTTKEFTIRITTTDNIVTDRTFSISISNASTPSINPAGSNIGTYIAGEYANILLTASESLVSSDITFTLKSGDLPPGVTLYSNGALQGYILPISNNQTANVTGFDKSKFDQFLLDFSGVSTSRNYQFQIQATDGLNIDIENYTIFVYDRAALTADSDIITADNAANVITADDTTLYSPILYTNTGIISSINVEDIYAYQFNAIDLDSDDLSFTLTSGTLPPGLVLSTNTGYITGLVDVANITSTDYSFNIQAYKTDNSSYVSEDKNYTIRVLGQLDDTITWITSANLGTIYAGEVSKIKLNAVPASNQTINYKLAANSLGTLPPGLQLMSDGLIVGRPSFFNTNYIYANLTSQFTVIPYNQNLEYTEDSRTFTLKVIKRTTDPYENLYFKLMSSTDQRGIYENIINNDNIASNDDLYRPGDLWFGRNNTGQVLFLSGLEVMSATSYVDAMSLNHYWKTILFGDIKTARATDSNLNVIYEVVYIELLDSDVNSAGEGPPLEFTWPTNQANISTVYPNSFHNMTDRLEVNVGYEDKGVLPAWMTSRQEDGRVLGFTRALVLFYTKPGSSKKVAFRLKQYVEEFNKVNFTIDRYEWDRSLNENPYVAATGKISGNTSSNLIIGQSGNINGTGTISGTTGNNFVTGTGTIFAQELQRDKPIYVANVLIGSVDRIYSNTNVKLKSSLTSTITNQTYVTTAVSTKFDTEIKLGDTLVYNDTVIGTVKKITSATNLTLYSDSTLTFSNVNFQHIQQDLYTTPGKATLFLKFPKTNILS